MGLEKVPLERPTMEVRPNGPLAGQTFVMYEPPSSLIFGPPRTQREVALVALESIVDSTLPFPEDEMPPAWAIGLSDAWVEGWQQSALPPTTGRASRRRLPSPPSTNER